MLDAKRVSQAHSDLLPDPIFVLGIKERSGTHFLTGLLYLHPDCDPGGPIWEDYLLVHSGLLVRYVESLYSSWNPKWKVEDLIGPPDALLSQLGETLISFLKLQILRQLDTNDKDPEQDQPVNRYSKRLITTTPSVQNLQHFFTLFPNAQLLILVRDGRAVVESGVRSFNWTYEQAIREWDQAARTIIRFDEQMKGTAHKYMIVRYEDLYKDMEGQLHAIFKFLGLNPDAYDFEAARNLPVFGSSDLRRQGERNLHWDPIKKTSTFNPIERWKDWGHFLHARFNWIAGDRLSGLGYEKHLLTGNQWRWAFWNTFLDLKWQIMSRLHKI